MSHPISRYFSVSSCSAGLIAVLVGYTSSAAIVFQAATAAGGSAADIASWLWALGLGMGLTCIGLSLYFRSPILTAWSTPGAALLVTSLSGVPMSEAVAIFLFSSALVVIAGVSGWFERFMHYVPKSLAAAMLAGILLRFGLSLFTRLPIDGALIGGMMGFFILARRFRPRYAVPLTLLCGVIIAYAQNTIHLEQVTFAVAYPIWTAPTWNLTTLLGVGLPLFIVTMASQNVPGVAVLRANGYETPASPIITKTGVAGLILAPFGGFSFNLAAITAAICMSRDADPDPARRYLASVWAGIFYLLTGIFGATVASVFSAFPEALVMGIAGLALLGTISAGLVSALQQPSDQEAALITFLATASGMTLWGLGSAFWGLVLGGIAYAVLHRR